MQNNTIKNLVIGSIALLGISYVAETCIKNKKREKMIEQSKMHEENTEENTERKYISLVEYYQDIVDGKIVIPGTTNNENVTEEKTFKRKYHTLKSYNKDELK